MFSYWEQQSFFEYDHIVVGAGIVGLSTAIEIKSRFPGASVLVLERGLLPTGASSRNAGFACMGSATEIIDDLQVMDEAAVCRLFESRKKGLERLRSRLGDQVIGYEASGSYELIGEKELFVMSELERLNELLLPITGTPAFSVSDEQIGGFGFNAGKVRHMIRNNFEGSINTGRMLRALTDLALRSGIEIKTGARVTSYEVSAQYVMVRVEDGFRQAELPLKSRTLTLCTNAFTRELMPEMDIRPGRGQVLITEPVEGLRFRGIFHFDHGYYYFREIDGRVLFGGGRNLAFEEEATTSFGLNERIQCDLEEKLRTMILPGTDFRIGQRWSGIMAFGPDKSPVVRAFNERLFGAFRMGGMGVALGSEVAMQVADMIYEAHH